VDGQGEDLAAAVAGRARVADRDRAFRVRERSAVEDAGDALPLLDLDQQGTAAVRSQRQRQRRGHRGLAGPTLPGDHVQPRRPAHMRVIAGWHVPRLPKGNPGTRPDAQRGSTASLRLMSTQRWEYATVPLLVHATKQI